MTGIVIIEDHLILREGLKCLLTQKHGLDVLGEAGDGRLARKLVEKLKPDMALMGLILPNGQHGLEVLRDLRSVTKALVLSMRTDEAFVAEAFRSGANGYVLKRDSFRELLRAIETVSSGGRYISSSLNVGRIGKLIEREARKRLTTRELEVLELAAEGLTSAQTAARLYLSRRTVEMHRGNLMRKLGLRSTADLVRYAIRNRVITA